MKLEIWSLALFLTLFLIAESCQKENPNPGSAMETYTVNIGISLSAKGKSGSVSKLLVTETGTGKELGVFEFSANLSKFKGELKVDGTPLMDLHLIFVPEFGWQNVVLSHIGVENGAFISFGGTEFGGILNNPIDITINGISAFDSVSTGLYAPLELKLDPQAKILKVKIQTTRNQGNMLRVRANNEPGFRYFYLPDSMAGKSLNISWIDVKTENNLTPIEISGNPYIYYEQVSALSPDFQKVIWLLWTNQATSMLPINLAGEIPSDWKLAVKLYGSPMDCEVLIDPSAPLLITPPQMTIDSAIISTNKIETYTSGEVDMVNVTFFKLNINFYWKISGSKSAMEQFPLPNLEPYLPPLTYQSPVTSTMVDAEHYDAYDYAEIRLGYPLLNPGFLRTARSGYYRIKKHY